MKQTLHNETPRTGPLAALSKIEDGEIVRPKFMLVYQAGIANVFRVDSFNLADHGRNAVRVYQGAFSQAEHVARGAGLAGAVVLTAAANLAGDIAREKWSDDLDAQPFSENFSPVFFTGGGK